MGKLAAESDGVSVSARRSRSMSDLLGEIPQAGETLPPTQNEARTLVAADTVAIEPVKEPASVAPRPKAREESAIRSTPPVRPAEPAAGVVVPVGPNAEWIHQEAKTIRFYPGQFPWLTQIRKELNDKRAARGKRITESTLVRIAVDLLAQDHADKLHGITENELRASVGLPPVDALAPGE